VIDDWFEPLWFIYYMFFAIHNPKLEEYINRKQCSLDRKDSYLPTHTETIYNPTLNKQQILDIEITISHILKNMLKRRSSISTIVYQLFEYAYINERAPTYVYPQVRTLNTSMTSTKSSQTIQKYAGGCANSIIKSFRSGHLKTTAVHIYKLYSNCIEDIDIVYRMFVESITHSKTLEYNVNETVNEICEKRQKIKYMRKDIIFLALVAYMHIKEEDINTRGVFISLTEEEVSNINSANVSNKLLCYEDNDVTSSHDIKPSLLYTKLQSNVEYEKYKYLLS